MHGCDEPQPRAAGDEFRQLVRHVRRHHEIDLHATADLTRLAPRCGLCVEFRRDDERCDEVLARAEDARRAQGRCEGLIAHRQGTAALQCRNNGKNMLTSEYG